MLTDGVVTGSKGDPYDNAVMESFFASLKSDRTSIHHYRTREEAIRDIVDYIEIFYNAVRKGLSEVSEIVGPDQI